MTSTSTAGGGAEYVTFHIEGDLPDLNAVINGAKANWATYHRTKRNWTFVAKLAAKETGVQFADDARVAVVFMWTPSSARKDPDNVSHGAKYILDGAVQAGLLSTDAYRTIGKISHVFLRPSREAPGVAVDIYRLPGP